VLHQVWESAGAQDVLTINRYANPALTIMALASRLAETLS
jgi:hypothetical protein